MAKNSYTEYLKEIEELREMVDIVREIMGKDPIDNLIELRHQDLNILEKA